MRSLDSSCPEFDEGLEMTANPNKARDMFLNDLIRLINNAYPDALIAQNWDFQDECPKVDAEEGDTLAEFIVLEIADTFEPDADDGEQMAGALRVITQAIDDLDRVANALNRRIVKKAA